MSTETAVKGILTTISNTGQGVLLEVFSKAHSKRFRIVGNALRLRHKTVEEALLLL